jgi:uncharacterized SAM-binding protein YcdF (DUF218 family)
MTDDILFVLRKIAGLAVSPMVWIVIGLVLTLVLLWRGRPLAARRVTTALLIGVLVVSILPLGWPVIAAREGQYPANPALGQVDGIILLGGAERLAISALHDRPEVSEAADRVPGERGEAEISAAILTGLGIAADRLIIESRARNTAENARLSLDRVAPTPQAHWVLVTSGFHMPRAMGAFTAAGWPEPTPYPVDFRTSTWRDTLGWHPHANMARLRSALREQLGRLVLHLTD